MTSPPAVEISVIVERAPVSMRVHKMGGASAHALASSGVALAYMCITIYGDIVGALPPEEKDPDLTGIFRYWMN